MVLLLYVACLPLSLAQLLSYSSNGVIDPSRCNIECTLRYPEPSPPEFIGFPYVLPTTVDIDSFAQYLPTGEVGGGSWWSNGDEQHTCGNWTTNLRGQFGYIGTSGAVSMCNTERSVLCICGYNFNDITLTPSQSPTLSIVYLDIEAYVPHLSANCLLLTNGHVYCNEGSWMRIAGLDTSPWKLEQAYKSFDVYYANGVVAHVDEDYAVTIRGEGECPIHSTAYSDQGYTWTIYQNSTRMHAVIDDYSLDDYGYMVCSGQYFMSLVRVDGHIAVYNLFSGVQIWTHDDSYPLHPEELVCSIDTACARKDLFVWCWNHASIKHTSVLIAPSQSIGIYLNRVVMLIRGYGVVHEIFTGVQNVYPMYANADRVYALGGLNGACIEYYHQYITCGQPGQLADATKLSLKFVK